MHRRLRGLAWHRTETIDLANFAAVAITAFGAYDRCAGALGQIFIHAAPTKSQTSQSQLRLESGKKAVEESRSKLPAEATAWVDDVWADPRYQRLKALRHPLTHDAVNRLVTGFAKPGHDDREARSGRSQSRSASSWSAC